LPHHLAPCRLVPLDQDLDCVVNHAKHGIRSGRT
jgi:hypothetical protein